MNGAETLANVSRSVATLWVGVMAGFFYAFSAVVMPGLSTADPAIAMEAMQAINASVRNIAFAVGFFGAPLACVAAMAHAAHRRDWPAGWMVLVGGSVYRWERLYDWCFWGHFSCQRAPERNFGFIGPRIARESFRDALLHWRMVDMEQYPNGRQRDCLCVHSL